MVYKYWLNILGRSHEAGLNLVRPEFPYFSSSRMKCVVLVPNLSAILHIVKMLASHLQ